MSETKAIHQVTINTISFAPGEIIPEAYLTEDVLDQLIRAGAIQTRDTEVKAEQEGEDDDAEPATTESPETDATEGEAPKSPKSRGRPRKKVAEK